MADKSSQLVLNALTRAAADPAGAPLHGGKNAPGLFPTTALGKQAAQRCHDEGYLRAVTADRTPTAPAGSSTTRTANSPVVTITDKGLAYLLSQVSPRQVLEDFVRVLESRESQVASLIALGRQMHASLEALRCSVAPVLAEVALTAANTRSVPLQTGQPSANGDLKGLFHEFCQEKPAPSDLSVAGLLAYLEQWERSGTLEDCPLPELYRCAGADPGWTIGAFHDALRRLQDQGQIHLHPWTGPLCNIPEPPYALLVGHTVSYYARLTQRNVP